MFSLIIRQATSGRRLLGENDLPAKASLVLNILASQRSSGCSTITRVSNDTRSKTFTSNSHNTALPRVPLSIVSFCRDCSCWTQSLAESRTRLQCDGTFRQVGRRGDRLLETGFALDFQTKASVDWTRENDNVVYSLEAKAYNDLVQRSNAERAIPFVGVLLCLPRIRGRVARRNHRSTCAQRVIFGLALKVNKLQILRPSVFAFLWLTW